MSEAKHPVRATETTLRLVRALKANDGGGVTELADELGLAKSAVHNHLSTLQEHGFVIHEASGRYHLSLKFLDFGGFRRNRMPIFNVAEPELNRLAEATGELANLLVEENGKGVYLYRAKGEDALDLDTYTGMRKHLHATALGKAVLAFLPGGRVEQIVEQHGLPRMTDRTVGTMAELRDELEAVREAGIAFDDGEATDGVRCVAAPVMADTDVLGAVSISAPTSRMRGPRFEETVPDEVRRTANVIELNIKYPSVLSP